MKTYMVPKGTQVTPDTVPKYCWSREQSVRSVSNNHFTASNIIKETIINEWFFIEDDILYVYTNEFLVRLPTCPNGKYNCFWIKIKTVVQY